MGAGPHPSEAVLETGDPSNLDTLVILVTDGMSLDLYCLGTWVGERDEPEWQDF
jgi:hypothetical protein